MKGCKTKTAYVGPCLSTEQRPDCAAKSFIVKTSAGATAGWLPNAAALSAPDRLDAAHILIYSLIMLNTGATAQNRYVQHPFAPHQWWCVHHC